MNTTTSTVAAGTIVLAGRWSQDKPFDIKVAIGTAGVALILSLMAQGKSEKLAQQFGLLILLAACFAYLPGLVTKLGLK